MAFFMLVMITVQPTSHSPLHTQLKTVPYGRTPYAKYEKQLLTYKYDAFAFVSGAWLNCERKLNTEVEEMARG